MKISPDCSRVVLAVIAGAIVFSAPALAQREVATALEEVIVTAQKREESLQEVPIAVTALNADALEKTFARDLTDITGAAPNLIIDPVLGNGTSAVSIRGMPRVSSNLTERTEHDGRRTLSPRLLGVAPLLRQDQARARKSIAT